MLFRQWFDSASSTYTYLLADEVSREAVVIDPVLEQEARDLSLIRELDLQVKFALDTHVHADHVTGVRAFREAFGARTVLSERAGTGSPDVLVKDGDVLAFGRCGLEVRETPGHTNGCVSYVTLDKAMVFTGDALLVRGSGRTDFQQGDARALYRSVHTKLFVLPDSTLVCPAHDYKGRMATSIGEEKRWNPRLGGGITEDEFVAIMQKLELGYPKQMDRALPANLGSGVPVALSADGEGRAPSDWAPLEWTMAGVPELTVAWVHANPQGYRLVDVREPDEFVGPLGHAHGAELVPLGTLTDAALPWEREEPIVFICRSGGRSAQAALALRSMGFVRTASVRGGMTAWNAAGFAVEERGPEHTGPRVIA